MGTMDQYILNISISPLDLRDYIYESNSDIPLTYDLRDFLLPIRDQGKQGSCYAQASSTMKEYQEFLDYSSKEYMSPQFIYNQRDNLYDDNPDNDSGMYGRNVMKILKNIGVCYEKSYPYGTLETKDQISNEIYQEAALHKIKNYAVIYSFHNLKSSIVQNGPCLITFPVYNYGMEMWKPEYDNQTFKGGHAMTVVGFTEDSFIIRNSWGTNFGDQGYCYYKFEDWGMHWELWTTVDEKTIFPEPKEEESEEEPDKESEEEPDKESEEEQEPDSEEEPEHESEEEPDKESEEEPEHESEEEPEHESEEEPDHESEEEPEHESEEEPEHESEEEPDHESEEEPEHESEE